VNAALRDPFKGAPGTYESGGPTDNVLSIWKAEAPAIDVLAPDIYLLDTQSYLKVLELYHRPDNALFIPETAGTPNAARFLFAALGMQTIGYSRSGWTTREPIIRREWCAMSRMPFLTPPRRTTSFSLR